MWRKRLVQVGDRKKAEEELMSQSLGLEEADGWR